MSSRVPESKREVVLAAARLHMRSDGTYSRQSIKELARINDVTDRTIRRWATNVDRGEKASSRKKGERPTQQQVLVALANNPGSLKAAWHWVQSQHDYKLGYETFIRDVRRLPPALTESAKIGSAGLIENRCYLTHHVPHRNAMWQMDHTLPPIYVLPDRGEVKFRPWLSVIVDAKTGYFMAIEAWEGHPNTETVTHTLTRAAVGDARWATDIPNVGGLPSILVFDNAAEHLAGAIREGCLRLGIVGSPNVAYHSWENGRVERAHRTMEADFLSSLPGFIKAGTKANHAPRFGPRGPGDPSPVALLNFSRFRALAEEWRVRYNTSHVGSDGMTRQQRWDADQTTIIPIQPALMLASLTVGDRLRTVNKAGVRFRNADYISSLLSAYRKRQLTVHYLPTVTDWIELFDGATYVGRAWRTDRLPERERNKFLLDRGAIEETARIVDQEAVAHRTHFAQVQNQISEGEEVPEPPSALDAIIGRPGRREPLPPVTPTRGSQSKRAAAGGKSKTAADAVAGLANIVDIAHLYTNQTEGQQS